MPCIEYDANSFNGFSEQSSWTDDTGADAQEIMGEICDYLSGEVYDPDDEIEVTFYDEETGDEIGRGFVSRDGWQVDPC